MKTTGDVRGITAGEEGRDCMSSHTEGGRERRRVLSSRRGEEGIWAESFVCKCNRQGRLEGGKGGSLRAELSTWTGAVAASAARQTTLQDSSADTPLRRKAAILPTRQAGRLWKNEGEGRDQHDEASSTRHITRTRKGKGDDIDCNGIYREVVDRDKAA